MDNTDRAFVGIMAFLIVGAVFCMIMAIVTATSFKDNCIADDGTFQTIANIQTCTKNGVTVRR